MEYDSFKEALLYYINNRGWTIRHVARKTKVPESTLYSWTCGKRIPPVWQQELLFFRMDHME
jgi:predicted transcriptional regulator